MFGALPSGNSCTNGTPFVIVKLTTCDAAGGIGLGLKLPSPPYVVVITCTPGSRHGAGEGAGVVIPPGGVQFSHEATPWLFNVICANCVPLSVSVTVPDGYPWPEAPTTSVVNSVRFVPYGSVRKLYKVVVVASGETVTGIEFETLPPK